MRNDAERADYKGADHQAGADRNGLADLMDRLDFMGLTEDSCRAIRLVSRTIDRELPVALDKFYDQIRKTPATRAFFSSESHIARAKGAQQNHWKSISAATFDRDYADRVNAIGSVHARIGLEPRWYIGGYAILLDHLVHAVVADLMPKGGLLSRKSAVSAEALADTIGSLCKSVLLEMDLTISVYLDEAEKARRKARDEAIRKEQVFVSDSFGSTIRQMAERNLAGQMQAELPAPYMPLRDDLNAAIDSLRETLAAVNRTTRLVDAAAGEIDSATRDLELRTEQQASSVERTAATVEQMTEAVSSTASRVSEANAFVGHCRSVTERFGAMIERATASMAEIERSSHAISAITEVMDSVATRTNLLALNTAVEAARAGDAGRSFSVLAQEIRDLASRAATASQEVRNLIKTSRQQVAAGVVVMEEASNAIGTIVAGVSEIGNHLNAIDNAAQEQAAALRDINGAVATIDQTARQNATMVRQTATASSDMAQQAGRLRALVDGFQLDPRRDGVLGFRG